VEGRNGGNTPRSFFGNRSVKSGTNANTFGEAGAELHSAGGGMQPSGFAEIFPWTVMTARALGDHRPESLERSHK
jgi:hypothetical protein